MKIITIDDFMGGKNTADNQSLIQNNQCVVSSVNVWAPSKTLTPTPGYSVAYTLTASGAGVSTGTNLYNSYTLSAVNYLYTRISVSSTGANPSSRLLYLGDGTTFTMLGYTTGTISISGASLISATGSGTSWTNNAASGDVMLVSGLDGRYTVLSVQDNTHLTLASAVPSAIATGTTYTLGLGFDYADMSWATIGSSADKYVIQSSENELMQFIATGGIFRSTAPPKAAFIAVHKNYLFAARTVTATSRLYWSNIKDPLTWTATNFIDVDRDNDSIVGLFSMANELMIFKNRTIFKLVGETFDASNVTYAVYPVATPPGYTFSSNWSVAVHNGVLVFYAGGHFWKYSAGTSYIQQISQIIGSDLPDFSISDNSTTHRIDERMYATSFNGRYICKGMLYNVATVRNSGYIIDERGAWWPFSDTTGSNTNKNPLGKTPIIYETRTTGRPRILSMADSGPARIYQLDFAESAPFTISYLENDNGTTTRVIPSWWKSKEFNIGFGAFKNVIIYFKKQTSGTVQFGWSIDQGSFITTSIDMTVGRGNIIRKVIDINQVGGSIQCQLLADASSPVAFEIYGIQILYEGEPENRRL